MTGAGQALTASHSAASLLMKASAAARSSPAISLMSAPPMNALSPAPRRTTTRQPSSRESLRNSAVSSSIASLPRMFIDFAFTIRGPPVPGSRESRPSAW